MLRCLELALYKLINCEAFVVFIALVELTKQREAKAVAVHCLDKEKGLVQIRLYTKHPIQA